MKLEQAVITYGLKPCTDFATWQAFEPTQHGNGPHVEQLIAMLNQRVFAGQLTVTAQLVVGHVPRDAGMNLRGLGAGGEYAWNVTMEVWTNNDWRCGLVEAMYRRYVMEALERNRVPDSVLGLATAWQRTWSA